MMKRNIDDYTRQYHALPFEPIQANYRRALVLREIERIAPRKLLEIGCGNFPLFTDLGDEVDITVIEPAAEFASNAYKLAEGRAQTSIVQCFIEDYTNPQVDFDMIVLSCLLHEVREPLTLLASVRSLCTPDTVLHVNVPNAGSLHRLLAVSMGLIPSPDVQSDTQRRMQQSGITYDMASLQRELSHAGFSVFENGSLFVKPFTHMQMQRLIDEGFMTQSMLDGFSKLVEFLPELGSEIWVNARIDQ